MTDYPLRPRLDCDVIMKGGITSGVIYPGAVCELAKTYRLRSIAGASAGAIAATAAAAAEHGRTVAATSQGPGIATAACGVSPGGFEMLDQLPNKITARSPAGGSVLLGLFQPQSSVAGLFRVLIAGLGRTGLSRAMVTFRAFIGSFAVGALLGALPGVVIVILGILGSGVARWAAIAAGVVLVVLGIVVGAAGVALRQTMALPESNFGMCSGMPASAAGKVDALTPWLHSLYQGLAGRPDGSDPLTFGDLAASGVELRLMTTNLTQRLPLAMPWPSQEYFFDPAHFRTLFPPEVVAWMECHPPKLSNRLSDRWRSQVLREHAHPLLPFPAADQLPVIVATRMSLSFPMLITAVPLHAVNYSSPHNQEAKTAIRDWRATHPNGSPAEAAAAVTGPLFEPNWFSDGGICSNLPVELFDNPLPTRPTFAINLKEITTDQESPNEADNTFLPEVNQGGLLRSWTTLPTSGLGSIVKFLNAIIDSARSWVDESHLVMPGYRDRVVTIYHTNQQGGMNLNMPAPVVAKLIERGRAGAEKLVTRFVGARPGDSPSEGWENQRWIRFRTATSDLSRWLAAFRNGYYNTPPATTPYADLAGRSAVQDPPSYPVPDNRRTALNSRTANLLGLIDDWATTPDDAFTANEPSHQTVLKVEPIFGEP